FSELVDLRDVRVDQIGHELGLADEVLEKGRLLGVIGLDELQGHAFLKSVRAVLDGLIDRTHPALAQVAQDAPGYLLLNVTFLQVGLGEESGKHADRLSDLGNGIKL